MLHKNRMGSRLQMGRLRIRQRIIIYFGAILLGLIVLCGLIIYLFNRNADTLIHNHARVLMSNSIYEMNQGDYTALEAYPYLAINLSGEVIHSNQKNGVVMSNVDMKTVTGNSYGKRMSENYIYSAPILKNGAQVGTIFVGIPYEELIEKPYYTIGFMVATSIALLITVIHFIRFLNQDILIPIRQIHLSTKKICEGDF